MIRRGDIVRLIALAAIWGASFVFIRVLAPVLGPAWTAAGRVLIAGVTMIAWFALTRFDAEFARRWKVYAVIGVVNSAIPFLLFGYAGLHLPASYMVILNSATPLFTALASALWLDERLGAIKFAGLIIGAAGVALVSRAGPVTPDPTFALAVAACLGAALCYALSSVFLKRRGAGARPTAVAGWSQLLAGLVLLPLAVANPPRADVTLAVIANLFALALLCSAVAYVLYFRLIDDIGPTKALTVTFLMPAFGMLWGALFLGEAITLPMLGGAALIVAGTALVLRPARRASGPDAPVWRAAYNAAMSAGPPHVVLCFAAEDRFAADTVIAALRDADLGCIVAPDDPADAAGIAAALAAARALVIVHSRVTGSDKAVLRVVEAASGRRLPLVVIRLDAARPATGLATFLRKAAAFDASDGTLPARLTALTIRVKRAAGIAMGDADAIDDGAGGIDLWAIERRRVHPGWWIGGALIVAGIAVLGWRAFERQAADVAYQRGVARLAAGDADAALRHFDDALARRPAWGAAWRQRGFATVDPKSQVDAFTRAIELDAADADALAGRGRAYAQLGDYRRAVADLGAALAHAPDTPSWYAERGMVRLLLGDDAGAAADFDRCRKLDPRCAETFGPRITAVETALGRPSRDWFAAR